MMQTYYPRLTADGMRRNKYWYQDNPFYQADYGLPNCTCYSWGRFWEIYGTDTPPRLSTGDAYLWYYYNQDGYSRGFDPDYGAILCLEDGPSGDGHVAIVEEIIRDENEEIEYIVCSNSAYEGEYFYLSRLYPPDYRPTVPSGSPAYTFQGFIYNPTENGQPLSQGDPVKPWLLKRKLWREEEKEL